MCKNGGLLIGWNKAQKRAIIVSGRCDSWECGECAEYKADHWRLRAEIGARAILNSGRPLDFVTITGHEKLGTFAATEAVWRKAWPALYAALKRECGDLMYMIIPERHKSGRMHVHAVWNAGVSKRWLKDNARKRGMGYQADVSHVSHEGSAVKYVTKYIGKNLGDDLPDRFRRIRVSNNWPDVPAPNTATSDLDWEYTRSEAVVMAWLAQCQAMHYSVVEQKTGEIFDYGAFEWSPAF